MKHKKNEFLKAHFDQNKIIFLHTIPALFIFYPIFLGKVFLPGSDLYFSHIPNLLFGNISQKLFGHLSSWNPYIFSGLNMYESMHSHALVIFLQPLRFLSEETAVWILGLMALINCVLIGIIWNHIASALKVSNSYLVGYVAQFGMFFWFTTTTFIGTFMYVGMSLAIYTLITWSKRIHVHNCLSLTASFILILSFPHPTYILGNLFPIIITAAIILRNNLKVKNNDKSFVIIFLGSLFVGLCLNIERYVPIINGLLSGTAINNSIPTQGNRVYFGLTTFNPTNFGINIGDSTRISTALGFSGSHIQAHVGLYFGIIPLLLVLYALTSVNNYRLRILFGAFMFFWLADLYGFQPFSDIFSILLPGMGTHPGIMKPIINWLFLLLLCQSLIIIERSTLEISLSTPKKISMFILSYVLFEILLIIKVSQDSEFKRVFGESQILSILFYTALLMILFGLVITLFTNVNISLLYIGLNSLLRLYTYTLIAISSFFLLLLKDSLTSGIKIILLNQLVFVFLYIIYENYQAKKYSMVYTNLGILTLILSYVYSSKSQNLPQSSNQNSVFGLLIGSLLFILQILITYKIVSSKSTDSNRKIGSLSSITLLSLISFTYVYMYSSTYSGSPFVDYKEYYPNNKTLIQESPNFRVNRVTKVNGIAGNELQASLSIPLEQRTYGGVDSSYDADYSKYIDYLNQPFPAITSRAGILTDIDNERSLDLLGVKYDINSGNQIVLRKNAISRFTAFSNFEISDPNTALKRILEPNFDPLEIVVISPKTSFPRITQSGLRSETLNYVEVDFDNLVLQVNERSSRVILFNDRWDDGWRAYWNGEEIPIYKANFIKMATVIPEGTGELRFSYKSDISFLISKLTEFATLSFLIMALWTSVTLLRRKKLVK
jgi:hypothetical protein